MRRRPAVPMVWVIPLVLALGTLAKHNRPRAAKAVSLGAFSVQASTSDEVLDVPDVLPIDVAKQAAFTQTGVQAPPRVAADSDFLKSSQHLLHEAEEDDDKPDVPQKPQEQPQPAQDKNLAQTYGADVASVIADVDRDAIGTIDQSPRHKVTDDSQLTSIGGSDDDDAPEAPVGHKVTDDSALKSIGGSDDDAPDAPVSTAAVSPPPKTEAEDAAEAEAMDIEIKHKGRRDFQQALGKDAPSSTIIVPKVEPVNAVTHSLADRERLVNEQVAADTEVTHSDRQRLLSSVPKRQIQAMPSASPQGREWSRNSQAITGTEELVEPHDRPEPIQEPEEPLEAAVPESLEEPEQHLQAQAPLEEPAAPARWSPKIAFDHASTSNSVGAAGPKSQVLSDHILASADHTPLMKEVVKNVPWLRWKSRGDGAIASVASDATDGSDSDFGFSQYLHDTGKQSDHGAIQKAQVGTSAQDKPRNFWDSFAKRTADVSSTATTTSTTTTTTTTTKTLEVDLGVDDTVSPNVAAARWLAGASWGISKEGPSGDSQADENALTSLQDTHKMLQVARDQFSTNPNFQSDLSTPPYSAPSSLWDAHKMLLDARDREEQF